jgi:hypothetical protein
MKTRHFLAFASVLLWSGITFAQQSGRSEPDFMRNPIHSELRQGFMFGVVGGASLFDGSGTPRPYLQRDDLHRVQLGPVLAPSYSLFIGDAPSDSIAFALQLDSASAHQSLVRRKSYSLTFRVDVYPFVSRGGQWRNIAISPRVGVGSLSYTTRG